MSFPTIYRELEKMVPKLLRETSTAQDIARKAGVGLNAVSGMATVVASFTLINDLTLGYTQEYPVDAEAFFPEDSELMSRYADLSEFTQARLLVTVSDVGLADSALLIDSDEVSFSPVLAAPLDTSGLHVGAWSSLSATQDNAVIRWKVSNPGLLEGSFSVGLIQLQLR